jgi:hypothetical protein
LLSKNKDCNFENFSTEELAANLRQFYANVRPKPRAGEENPEYSKSAFRNMRAGLNRYLVSPPFNRQLNIMSDREFQSANQCYDGKLKTLKKEGKDKIQHKPAIDPADIKKFYASGTLSNNNPISLQRKVWFEISLHFGRRGREGWRSLTKESFIEKKDSEGRTYITLAFQEFDKNHPNTEEKEQRMYSTNDESCPVASFNLYLQKLNPKCSAFLQRPDPHFQGKTTWYQNAAVGINTIASMLKCISKEANASKTYTNHSVKASTATILKKAGIPAQDIMAVTGHRNIASLESYAQGPTSDDRAKMSKILATFGKESNSTININTPATTTTTEVTNYSAMSSIFAGANFSGDVTINVQINK